MSIKHILIREKYAWRIPIKFYRLFDNEKLLAIIKQIAKNTVDPNTIVLDTNVITFNCRSGKTNVETIVKQLHNYLQHVYSNPDNYLPYSDWKNQ